MPTLNSEEALRLAETEFVTTAEAETLTGHSRTTIRNAMKDGRLPFRQIGRTYLLPRAAVEDFHAIDRQEAGRRGAKAKWGTRAEKPELPKRKQGRPKGSVGGQAIVMVEGEAARIPKSVARQLAEEATGAGNGAVVIVDDQRIRVSRSMARKVMYESPTAKLIPPKAKKVFGL